MIINTEKTKKRTRTKPFNFPYHDSYFTNLDGNIMAANFSIRKGRKSNMRFSIVQFAKTNFENTGVFFNSKNDYNSNHLELNNYMRKDDDIANFIVKMKALNLCLKAFQTVIQQTKNSITDMKLNVVSTKNWGGFALVQLHINGNRSIQINDCDNSISFVINYEKDPKQWNRVITFIFEVSNLIDKFLMEIESYLENNGFLNILNISEKAFQNLKYMPKYF